MVVVFLGEYVVCLLCDYMIWCDEVQVVCDKVKVNFVVVENSSVCIDDDKVIECQVLKIELIVCEQVFVEVQKGLDDVMILVKDLVSVVIVGIMVGLIVQGGGIGKVDIDIGVIVVVVGLVERIVVLFYVDELLMFCIGYLFDFQNGVLLFGNFDVFKMCLSLLIEKQNVD